MTKKKDTFIIIQLSMTIFIKKIVKKSNGKQQNYSWVFMHPLF